MKVTLVLAVALFVAVAPTTPSELLIELDPTSTSINFRLGATLHTVEGRADAVSGSFRLDTESGALVGRVTVDAISADTGNSKRDRKMHTKVLRSAEYPQIALHSHNVKGDLSINGRSHVMLYGDMEILGRTHEIEILIDVEISGDRFTASTTFDVPYVDWGLEDPSTFVLRVAKTVAITVRCEGSVVLVE